MHGVEAEALEGEVSINERMWRLNRPPYEVQKRIHRWLRGRDAAGIFAEMGLGKTSMVLADFAALRKEAKKPPQGLVVICPNSLKQTWIEEAEITGLTDMGLETYHWPKSDPRGSTGAWLFTINYEALLHKGGKALDEIIARYPVYVTLDESVAIKNPQAKRTKWLLQRAHLMGHRRILSGAPAVQGPHDYWAQLAFLRPGGMKSYYSFRNRFCQMGGYLGKQILGVLKGKEAELTTHVSRDCIRARTRDWTDRPPVVFSTRTVELPKEVRKRYEEMRELFETEIANGEVVETQQAVHKMMKLQQLSCGFIIDNEGNSHRLVKKNPRIEVVREIFEQTEGKVLVGCAHKESVNWLEEELAEFNPAVMRGGMSVDELKAEKTNFEKDPTCRGFIVQVQTGRYGHTLLGDLNSGDENLCYTTVFFENTYSLNDRIQFEARNDRWGQRRTVNIIDIISTGADKNVVAALQKKLNITSAIIDGVTGA